MKFIALLVLAAGYFVYATTLHGQTVMSETEHLVHPALPPTSTVCSGRATPLALKEALELVCLKSREPIVDTAKQNAIVIGFVGGFVKYNDARHPEVLFAEYLRHRYPSSVHVEVFANRDGKRAMRRVLSLLDSNGDGLLADGEKQQAKIIIYGHSWGASQAVHLARELGRKGIPVLLTIQVDSIHKFAQNDSRIPANVESAVNFYQPGGLLHGRSEIRSEDPAQTKILGNFRMTYKGRRIDCSNYPWMVRFLNKPHHKIENDPRVWDKIASLIEAELVGSMRNNSSVDPPSVHGPAM